MTLTTAWSVASTFHATDQGSPRMAPGLVGETVSDMVTPSSDES